MDSSQLNGDFIFVHNSLATLGALRGDLIRLALERDFKVHAIVPDDHEGPLPRFCHSPRFRLSRITLDRTSLGIVGELSSLFSIRDCLRQADSNSFVIVTTIKPLFYVGMLKRLGLLPEHLRTTGLITGLGFVFSGDSMKSRFIRGFFAPFYRYALKSYSRLLFQNQDDLRFFLERGLIATKQNAQWVGSGVNLELFSASPVPLNPIRFLFVGRLLKSKGLIEFLEAADTVRARNPHVEFVVVGGFDSNPAALQMIDLEPYIRRGVIQYRGYLSDVGDAVRSSSCIVLPSYREGVPRVILEAMSSGRAAIVSNAPGCREMVEDSVTGFVVPVRDSNALAQAMERLIQSSDLLTRFGAAARRRAERHFDQLQINDRILGLVQGLDERTTPSPG